MNSQQDIMSVCLAVVRGMITPEQAKEAISGRSTSEPVHQILRFSVNLARESGDLSLLPEGERDECLDLFMDLYSQSSGEDLLRQDEVLAGVLVQHHLLSSSQADECLGIQKDLLKSGVQPLPRLSELLIKKSYLILGPIGSPFATSAGRDGTIETPEDSQLSQLPAEVRLALHDVECRYGRYVRTSLLGLGGVGEVWKAWDLELRRWVALKFLKSESPHELIRLKREAQTAARLAHPGIVRVFEIGECRDRTFLALEFIEGRTLDTYPRSDHRKLVSLVKDVALAIEFAHSKGVIHRDIKPGNIMIDSSGRASVMDFGLARQVESKHSISGHTLGTPTYMSPEQATGGAGDERSDIYSLGATLYELLADRPPFRGKNVYETLEKVVTQDPAPLAEIAADLQTITSKCLSKEPARRYSTAGDLAEELRRWLEGEAIMAHPPSTFYRLRKKAAKWKAVIGVGLASLLVTAGVAAWAVPRWLRADRAETLKELELAAEKSARAREERAMELARPHLDEGRKLHARLDRLLTTESWTYKDFRRLVDQAHLEFERALEIYPNHPSALLETSRGFQYENKRDDAINCCGKAIAASRGFATAYLHRARLLLDQYEELRHATGRFVGLETGEGISLAERIREDLKEVKAWSKDPREIIFADGALAFVDGDYQNAARLLEEYSGVALSDYRGWEWTAHAWLRIPGFEAHAVSALNEALKYRPRLPTLLGFRGTAYLQESMRHRRMQEKEKASKLRAQAIDDFKHAREIDPMERAAHRGLGEACFEAGEGSLAIAHFTQALSVDPKDTATLIGRARSRLREGDFVGASSDADEAIRLGSPDPKVYVVRGRSRLARSDFMGASADLDLALRRDPRDAEGILGMADLRRERGDAAGALQEYEQALSIDPSLADAYHHRAITERAQGNLTQAVADLTKALASDPGNPWIYYDLGVCAANRHDWEEAVIKFRKGLARMPSDPVPFWTRIWIVRARQGESKAAREELVMMTTDKVLESLPEASSRVFALLLGHISIQHFLENAERDRWRKGDLSRAYFYAGQRALIEGETATAKQLLDRCLKIGSRTSPEYSTAEADLKQLGTHQ